MKKGARVVVVGGGLSGLVAARRLNERRPDLDVRILEASERAGGILGTLEHDGFVIETGPDSILSSKPAAVELARELGIADRIVETNDAHRGAYVVHRGRLVHVPDGFSLMAPTRMLPWAATPIISWRGKLRAAIEPLVPRRGSSEEESLASFVTRRFGPELLDRLAQPLIGGIYGGDPDRLSLRATMPRFIAMEQRHGSVIRGMRAGQKGDDVQASGARYGLFVAFDRGMQVLIDALVDAVGDRLALRAPVERLTRTSEGWRVGELDADAVVLALPAWRSAALLAPHDAALADGMRAIPYGSAATVTFAWPRDAFAHPPDAFGIVVPTVERRGILAATFASTKWPGRAPEGQALVRVFIGGANALDVPDLDDASLVALARRELVRLMGVRGEPRFSFVRRYVRAMPQYVLGHEARVDALESRAGAHADLAVVGNAYRGVGIPDTIAYARARIDRWLARS
ncbi:MAG: protoporphyrinogen oxidase [Sandaracinaceae bacterium]